MMLLSGVRSSWLMVARKSLLSRLVSYSAMFARASSSTLRSRSAFTFLLRSCMFARLRSMRLKACDRSSNSSPVWISLRTLSSPGRDGVGDLLQVLDRLDDDVADDEVAAGHDEQRRADGERDEQARLVWKPSSIGCVERRMRTTAIRSSRLQVRDRRASATLRRVAVALDARLPRPGSPRSSRTRSPSGPAAMSSFIVGSFSIRCSIGRSSLVGLLVGGLWRPGLMNW